MRKCVDQCGVLPESARITSNLNDLSGVASLNLGVSLHKTGKFLIARSRFDEVHALFTSIGHQPYRLLVTKLLCERLRLVA